jgi:hypothetical protein
MITDITQIRQAPHKATAFGANTAVSVYGLAQPTSPHGR